MRIPALTAAFLCFALSAAIARADWNDPNVEGAKEHPLLKYYPQASVTVYSQKEFDSAELITGYKKGAGEPVVTQNIEGRVTKYRYEHKPQTAPLEIVRQYEGALKKAGFTTVLAGKEAQFPGIPSAAMGSFHLDRDGKTLAWVNVSAYELNGPDDPISEVTIVELKQMDQKLEANADALFDELQKSGHVAVYGINFDTGKATIKPESDKVLAEVGKLLAQHADLRLRIEGHTDNVGNAAANLKLSNERAVAVRNWLVQKGAKSANLATTGFGDSKPVGDNKTEAGRAKNRRVELVKQ